MHYLNTPNTSQRNVHEYPWKSESLLDSITRVAPIGIGVVKERIIQAVNEQFCQMIGYTAIELIGNSVRFLYPTQEDYDYVGREKYLKISHNGSGSVETRLKKKDGAIITVLLSSTLVDQSDPSIGVTVTVMDISARNLFAEAVLIGEKRFRTLADNAPDMMYRISLPDQKLEYINKASVQLTGFSPEEFYSHQDLLRKIIPADWEYFFKQAWNSLLNGNITPCYEFRIIDKSGSSRWVHLRNNLVKNARGTPEALEGIVTDITDRKNIETTLLEGEEKYRALFDDAGDAIFIHDENGLIISANAKICEQLGYACHELLSMTVHQVYSPEGASLTKDKIETLMTSGQFSFETSFLRNDGSLIPIEVRAQQVMWGGQNAVISICRDITGRKRAEEALHEANQKLRLLVGQTRHDIYNQITAGQLILDLALEVSDSQEVDDHILRVREVHERIQTIIEFTQEYENIGTLSSGWYPIYSLLESAQTEVHLGEIQILNQVPEDLTFYTDPIIRKVFATLIENGIRHGGEEINTIRFSCHTCNDTLIITYEDDGVGIPEKEKEYIFNQGYGKNTGFGLFLTRDILSIAGLSIRECGVSGVGARFEISIPAGKFRRTGSGNFVCGGEE